jgi:hypothetical protein
MIVKGCHCKHMTVMCVVLERLSVLSVPLPGSWADRSPLHEAACHGRLLALRTLLSQVSHTQRGGAPHRKDFWSIVYTVLRQRDFFDTFI